MAGALQRLFENLGRAPIPATLVSQHFPDCAFGAIPNDPDVLVDRRIQDCAARYFEACEFEVHR